MRSHWHRVIGRVSFVNCDPLYHNLPEEWKVLPAPPAWLTGHLLRKDCLTAPIPAADFADNADQLVLLPGLGIASEAEVGSVVLFGDRDPSMMRDIALPSDSSTSRRLLIWLLGQMGFEPRPVEMGPDLAEMLNRCDGALLIGDRALDEAARHPELIRMDLGKSWREMTGLPMVFGVFAVHRDAPIEKVRLAHEMLLKQARMFSEDSVLRQQVIERTSNRSGFSIERLDRYFGEVIHELDETAMQGLDMFLREVCGLQEWEQLLSA
uniref:Chorismate dehydratase n=1 Tax=uncultured marine group II/III euryarchaeote KM3_28_D12 TaxID=1456431 RepID=A0A075H1C1_9EURY|nr:putative periplasmic solute-binding protein [uncultured marine group II/III euryarchaeote KM3_28_D12]